MDARPATRQAKKRRKRQSLQERLSRLHKPDHLSLEAWQVELRRQFGREQQFRLKKAGDGDVFTEYEVVNPGSQTSYRVAIRGRELGENHCTPGLHDQHAGHLQAH